MDDELLQLVSEHVTTGDLTEPAGDNLVRWLTHPLYADTAPLLEKSLRHGEWDLLQEQFGESVPFGTGGRRGRMGILGPATINDWTIAEAAHGLAVYCREAISSLEYRAVVAYDGRHHSRHFAEVTAAILAAHGFDVWLFPEPRSTPQLSFTVRHLDCQVGVMISASHNPPQDNGFKAYWCDGGQVVPPHDQGIVSAFQQLRLVPPAHFQAAVSSGQIQLVSDEVDQAYVDATVSRSLSSARDVRVLFTPLHGVGESSVHRVLKLAGFARVDLFAEQQAVDGDFPNVTDHLPNPERPEVLAPAIQQAESDRYDLVLGSDPDADRLAVVARDHTGRLQSFTGNQLAALLTDFLVRKRREKQRQNTDDTVITTFVTSPLVGKIARTAGVRVIDHLNVGFKYIAREIERIGPPNFLWGCEESLGYLYGTQVRDKDAALAALLVCELAAELNAKAKTLWDQLADLHRIHGMHLEAQLSLGLPTTAGASVCERILDQLRSLLPPDLEEVLWSQLLDHRNNQSRTLHGENTSEWGMQPAGNMLSLRGQMGDTLFRATLRPSGTEPKLKAYLFIEDSPMVCQETRLRMKNPQAVMVWLKDVVKNWLEKAISG